MFVSMAAVAHDEPGNPVHVGSHDVGTPERGFSQDLSPSEAEFSQEDSPLRLPSFSAAFPPCGFVTGQVRPLPSWPRGFSPGGGDDVSRGHDGRDQ